MIGEAIILAGGLGTRLRSAVPDLPKCMAPVAGKPFLSYVIEYFRKQHIGRFIFSLGYKHEAIEEFLQKNFIDLNYSCFVEDEPLGTGGAILKASSLAMSKNVLVLNGDTLFAINTRDISNVHEREKAVCTLSLKPMKNTDRYGVVETGNEGNIKSFKEKKWYADSLINGGVYALDLDRFGNLPFQEKFSFEKDFLEKYYTTLPMFGVVQNGYFIDIGIPEDFERAQIELKSHV